MKITDSSSTCVHCVMRRVISGTIIPLVRSLISHCCLIMEELYFLPHSWHCGVGIKDIFSAFN